MRIRGRASCSAVPARTRPRRVRRGAALRWQAAFPGGESRRQVREVRRHRAADSQRHDGASQLQQRRGGKAIRATLQAALQGPPQALRDKRPVKLPLNQHPANNESHIAARRQKTQDSYTSAAVQGGGQLDFFAHHSV